MNIECNLILIIDKLMKRNEMAYPQMFQRHTLEATMHDFNSSMTTAS